MVRDDGVWSWVAVIEEKVMRNCQVQNNISLIKLVDKLNEDCERKRGVKDDSNLITWENDTAVDQAQEQRDGAGLLENSTWSGTLSGLTYLLGGGIFISVLWER